MRRKLAQQQQERTSRCWRLCQQVPWCTCCTRAAGFACLVQFSGSGAEDGRWYNQMDGYQPLVHISPWFIAPEQPPPPPHDCLSISFHICALHHVTGKTVSSTFTWQTHDVRATSQCGNFDSFHLRLGLQQTSQVQDLHVSDPASCSVLWLPL